MNLDQLRASIDTIDEQIVALLNERAALAQQVGRVKKNPVKYAPARVEQVLRHVLSVNNGPFKKESLMAVFREIVACGLALEQPLKVSYLGPAGTYSEEAARNRFGTPVELVPCDTLEQTVRAAEQGKADVAIVPVENSTEGAVNHTLDLLLQTPLKIVSELELAIHHQLLSRAAGLGDVTTVAAHPQALAQCRDWLHHHLPHAKQVAMDSNAQAAVAAEKDPGLAAIAGKIAASQYKLPVLATNIEDDSANTTRFIVLGDAPGHPTGQDKTSLICSVPEQPGALGHLINILSEANINMSKLYSRPSPGGLWDYVFYIDIDGHAEDPAVASALDGLRQRASFLKVVGSYPRAAK